MTKPIRLALALGVAVALAVALTPAQTPECGPAQKFATPAKAGTHAMLPAPGTGQWLHVCAGEIVVAGSPKVVFAWNDVSVQASSGRQVFQIPTGPVPLGQGLSLKVSTGIAVTGWVRVRVVGAVTPPPSGDDPDGDGVAVDYDLCPTVKGNLNTGCIGLDTDGDREADMYDLCPTIPGPINGCPATPAPDADTDGDGVPDTKDVCPLVSAKTETGCPAPPPPPPPPVVDGDKDGFADVIDKCPQVKGVAPDGCPAPPPPPPPSGDSPLSRNEHPRMLVTSDNLPRLRARMATGGGLHDDAVWWANTLDLNLDNPWMRGDLIYHNYALAYLFLKDGPIAGVPFRRTALEYGTAAKSMALGYLEGAEGDVMLTMMLDWLWDLWTPAERLRFAAYIKGSDAKTDWGGAWVSQHAWIRAVRTVGAIALYGAGLEDEWAKERLSSFRAWFRDQTGITRAESDLGAGVDAGCGQSSSYCDNTLTNLLLAEEAYRTAYNIPDSVHYGGADTNFFRLQAEYDLHHLMPNADPAMRVRYPWTLDRGRYGQSGQIIGPDRASGTSYLSIAGMYETHEPQVAATAMWLMDRVWGGPYHGWTFLAHDWWWFHGLIRGPERRPTPTPPAEMGKPFHVVSPNMGRVLWSTNWLRPDDVQVVFDAEHWALADSLLRPGTFQVFRKGPMIVHQGGGTGGHDQTPCNGAHSGNILLFPLPRMNDCGGSSGGGQNSGSNLFIPGSVSDLRDALDVVDTPTYGYLYADITRAYRSTRRIPPFDVPPPLRVSEVTRQIAYLKPATTSDPVILVILDRATTTAADMEKRWLVHPACAPVVQPDASIQCVNTEFGSNGKVIITPILPATRSVKVWEGYDSPYGDMAKPIASQMPAQFQWVGNWTLDLRPTVPQTSDVFLTVIEVTDANGTKTPITYLGGESVQVGSRVVTFSATGVTVK